MSSPGTADRASAARRMAHTDRPDRRSLPSAGRLHRWHRLPAANCRVPAGAVVDD
nr:MAG TPA: hypothetical protein [Caudoviricetes sp.]